jgi:hypothetical protein
VKNWIKSAVIAAALAGALIPFSPSFIERWYSTGLYPNVQRVVTPVTNLVPFALFDVLTVVAFVCALIALVRSVRVRRGDCADGRGFSPRV